MTAWSTTGATSSPSNRRSPRLPGPRHKLLDCDHVTESVHEWPARASFTQPRRRLSSRRLGTAYRAAGRESPPLELALAASGLPGRRRQFLPGRATTVARRHADPWHAADLVAAAFGEPDRPPPRPARLPHPATRRDDLHRQMVHQETLFFTLPFLLATTVWTSGQALFTLAMVALAILSILDPLYYRLAERRRGSTLPSTPSACSWSSW